MVKITCSKCGKSIKNFHILDGKIVCDDCIKGCHLCDECGTYHEKETHKVKNKNYCDYCTKVYTFICPYCGEIYHVNDRRTIKNKHCCINCYSEKSKYLIKQYHDNPTWTTYGKDNIHTFGVELEVDCGKKNKLDDDSEGVLKILGDGCYTMRDGSLNSGFEIITHPHDEEALYNLKWEEAFEYLTSRGYRSDMTNTCGLHLHMSEKFFDENSLVKLVYFYDKYYDEVVKMSRRKYTEANRWARRYYQSLYNSHDVEHCLSTIKSEIIPMRERKSHYDRYHCVNVVKNNTIEIRIMKGTLNINTFKATLDFMINICKNASVVNDVNNLSEWFAGMKPETLEYLKNRNSFNNYFNPEEETIIVDDIITDPVIYPTDTDCFRTHDGMIWTDAICCSPNNIRYSTDTIYDTNNLWSI